MSPAFSLLEESLASRHQALVVHPLYRRLKDPAVLRRFTESHVFAVWDFMTLLKTLQQRLTCVTTPWMPPANRLAARLVNEIVLAEESDEVLPGVYQSHFELYLDAMAEIGADMRPIRAFLGAGADISRIPSGPREFVASTLAIAEKSTVEVAAAFLVGRERLVPAMFETMLRADVKSPTLRLYLERHVALDGEVHGPMAERLLGSLCETSEDWAAAERAAKASLEARMNLWNALLLAEPMQSTRNLERFVNAPT